MTNKKDKQKRQTTTRATTTQKATAKTRAAAKHKCGGKGKSNGRFDQMDMIEKLWIFNAVRQE
jgi:hypothetical protein